MHECLTCMYMYHVHEVLAEVITRFIGGCELSCGCCLLSADSLHKQQVRLTAGTFLKPIFGMFLKAKKTIHIIMTVDCQHKVELYLIILICNSRFSPRNI